MSVLNSRRLWTFIIAQVVSVVTLVVGHYVTDPFYAQLSVALIGTAEGVAAILISAYTLDDIKGKAAQIKADQEIQMHAISAGMHPKYAPPVPPFTK